jgi:hypothetical protein
MRKVAHSGKDLKISKGKSIEKTEGITNGHAYGQSNDKKLYRR